MKKYLLILISSFLFQLQASHILGGEISYQPDATTPSKYLFTVSVVYNAELVTDSPNDLSKIDVSTLPIDFGDNTNATLLLDGGLQAAGNGAVKAVYKGTHVFPFANTYVVSIQDSYRPDYIINIPKTKPHVIYFSTTVNLSVKDQGLQFLDFPRMVPKDAVYTYEPQIVNPDKDILTFSLITPYTGFSQTIQDYKYPADPSINGGTTGSVFSVDFNTGKITWNKPITTGHYCIAIMVRKIRENILVSTTIRDYSLVVEDAVVSIDDEMQYTQALLSTNLVSADATWSVQASGDLTVTDVSGRLVFEQSNYVANSPIALHVKPGMYICTLRGQHNQQSERFVVE